MAFELYGPDNRRFSFARWEWESVLALAQHFGWESQGPVAHPDEPDDRIGYDTSAFQAVAGSDAAGLADALEKAIAASTDAQLSAVDAGAPEDREIDGEVFAVPRRSAGDPSAWRRRLGEFIAFCRTGGFVIG